MNRLFTGCPAALAASLRTYFRSGWAFLIPYLAAYLLFYLLKWPVNPWSGAGASTPGTSQIAPGSLFAAPCLLHVYWTLHAINVGLAIVALVSWWRGRWQGIACKQAPTAPLSPVKQAAGTSQESTEDGEDGVSAFSFQLSAFLPWIFLALLFYLPGVYMEFPADPWAHFGRINEWSWLQTVGGHTEWAKSSYFLAYSLLGRIATPTRQLFWLNFYYAGCCLLLCWQYYRLARTVGLGERASLLFVILQSVLFGNNIFGFYRYYGIASTIFAQIAAVALIRVAIEVASSKIQIPKSRSQGTDAEVSQESAEAAKQGVSAFSFQLSAFSSGLGLLALVAFNHPQGLGISASGLAAVVIWRLIEWKRSMAWWLAAAALALSVAAVLWWPRHPALDSAYRPGGWLTVWYGFDVFSFYTDAGDRTRQIIGFFGLINLAAGLVLLRRNHVVAWLTGVPLAALCFPFVAIPFAGLLAKNTSGLGQIILFQRILLAIPAGLALICAAASRANQTVSARPKLDPPTAHGDIARERAPSAHGFGLDALGFRFPGLSFQLSAFHVLLLTLSALLLVPANRPFYNRLWQALMVPPDDLAMRQVIEATDAMAFGGTEGSESGEKPLLAIPGIGYVLESAGRTCLFDTNRLVQKPPASITDAMVEKLHLADPGVVRDEPFWAVDVLYTPFSQCGSLSGHWLPTDVALELSTQEELFRAPLQPAEEQHPPKLWLEWISGPKKNHYWGNEGSTPLKVAVEDRGMMNSQQGFATPVAGDQLVLIPVLETMGRNCWQVSMDVTGPESFHRFWAVTRRPTPLGSDRWIFSSFRVRFPNPGQYTIKVAGYAVWPVKTYAVRYVLTVAAVSRSAGN